MAGPSSCVVGLTCGILKRPPEVAVEEVDVGRQCEGGGVVAEPPLHPHGVASLYEQNRGAGVAERRRRVFALPLAPHRIPLAEDVRRTRKAPP